MDWGIFLGSQGERIPTDENFQARSENAPLRKQDSNIRQSLINRFGSPGTKKCKGITYGISGDQWSALGVAVTAKETRLQNTLLASRVSKAETPNEILKV